MLIRSTAHPSFCPSAILPIRPTTDVGRMGKKICPFSRVLVLYLGSGSDPKDDFLEELMDEFKLELLVVILLI